MNDKIIPNPPYSAEAEYVAGQNLRASHEIMLLLERSKANADEMINRLPDIFVIVDSSGLIWKGNQAAADVFGLGREDLIKTHLSRLFEPETWKVMRTKLGLFADDSARDEAVEFELPMNGIKGPSREFFWNFRSYERSFSKQKTLICILGRDISQIRSYQRQMSQIFFSIPLGILTINREGVVVGPYSAYTEHLLEQDQLTGKSLKRIIFDPIEGGLSKAEQDSVVTLFECIGSEESWFNAMKVHFPIELPFRSKLSGLHEDRWLGLSYHAICHGEKVDKVLVVIEDRTAVVQSRVAAERQRSRDEELVHRLLEISHCDEDRLALAVVEMQKLYDELDESFVQNRLIDICQNLRKIGELSGEVGFTRLRVMAEDLAQLLNLCIEGEKALEETMLQVRYMEIKMEWRQVSSLYFRFGSQLSSSVGFLLSDQEKQRKLREDLDGKVISPLLKLANMVDPSLRPHVQVICDSLMDIKKNVGSVPLRDLETGLSKYSSRIAAKLDKKIKVHFDIVDTKIDGKSFLQISRILSNLISNGIDHGIEVEEERKLLGKTSEGLLVVEVKEQDGMLMFSVKDDGKGISPDGLKGFAIKHNLISIDEASHLTDDQALYLITRPGFSNSDSLMDLKSRGLGLNSVVEEIKRLGGKDLNISSTVHKGSIFSFAISASF